MIIIKLFGGLGNQMFQYALGRSLSLKKSVPLYLDISWFKKVGDKNDRPYQLNIFNINSKTTDSIALTALFTIFGKIFKSFSIKERYFFKFDNLIVKNKKGYFDGYWQNEKYFKDIRGQLLEEFTLKNKISETVNTIKEKIIFNNSVSVHVRRGDFIQSQNNHNLHGVCSLAYYSEAMEIIEKKINNPHYFVFSDDIDWVRKNLIFNHLAVFVSGNGISAAEEMILMSYCKSNIIANSSFSWWGAWLNNNLNKIVIAPNKWGDNDSIDTSDLIPEEWIKI